MPHRPRLFALLLLTVGLTLSSPAEADIIVATHHGELKESSHKVMVRQDGHDLVLRVERSFRNLGQRVDELDLSISLPPGGVATGLRTRLGKTWYPGRLLHAKEARQQYEHLTVNGPVGSRGPALLAFAGQGQLQLRVFPVVPGQRTTVEYELRVPTCYRDGHRLAYYPKADGLEQEAGELPMRKARIRFAKGLASHASLHASPDALPAAQRDLVDECNAESSWLSDWGMDEQTLLMLKDSDTQGPVRASIGTHVLGAQRMLGELFLELSAKIQALPKRAELVFVVDASISQGRGQVYAQLRMIERYLSFLPDASFEVVVYRRRAERLFGRFQPARHAKALLLPHQKQTPNLGNGSNLDAGIKLAAESLGSSDRPQRIIAMTDLSLRSKLQPESVRAALAPAKAALLHLVDINGSGGAYEFERDDAHFLAEAVMETGGMLVSLYGGEDVKAGDTGLLGLVRPVQVDHFRVLGGESWSAFPDTAPEGWGYRAMVMLSAMPESLAVEGKIWGRDIHVQAKVDDSASINVPALTIGRSILESLRPDEVLATAQAGQVVSPLTSFLARDLQATPNSYDYEEDMGGIFGGLRGIGIGGASSCGTCGIGGYGTGHAVDQPDYSAALAGLLEDSLDACERLHGGAVESLAMAIETTGMEVVDVHVAKEGELAECAREAAWDLRLGVYFTSSGGRYPLAANELSQ